MSILPVVLANESLSAEGKLRLGPALIYDSKPLDSEDRFQYWYQWMILGISLSSLSLPLSYYLFVFVSYKWRRYKARPKEVVVEPSGKLIQKLQAVNITPYRDKPHELGKVSSFALLDNSQPKDLHGIEALDDVDLLAMPLQADVQHLHKMTSSLLAYCDIGVLLPDAQVSSSDKRHDEILPTLMRTIHETFSKDSLFCGVLLRLSSSLSPQGWMTLAQHLKALGLRVFFEVHPNYGDLVGINLIVADGLIIRNATILPNGLRRDFFRGFDLRDVLGRCNKQRAARPEFVTVLHDPCLLPSIPTLRRAYKFARFHEVLLTVCDEDLQSVPGCLPIEEPQSAFDWLKRPDVLDLHRLWNEASISDTSMPSRAIDLAAFESVLPGLEATFFTVPSAVDRSRDPGITMSAPRWVESIPTRASFFMNGENGQLLSKLACFDLREQITDVHVTSVLQTQRHMRKLALSEQISIYELQEVLESFEPFITNSEVQQSLTKTELRLIETCLQNLKDGSLKVIRGLDSGFTLPENRFHMWSVSEEDEDVEYIYVSLAVKDLVAVLLHTFLIVHGIQRRRCFELELILAASQGLAQGLPTRIVSELRRSTHAELITHLQQIRISRDADCSILQNVAYFVNYLLIEEATKSAWKKSHGEGFLSEKLSFRDLCVERLDWLAQRGAQALPMLDALVRMYRIAEHNILAALRRNDSKAIDLITKALCDSYQATQTEASIEQDLLGLIIFCIFRKYGVEETYIESSDRCPVYHFQTDQPGVFSELWVIGSQCEVYFDVTPGVLGAMHYERYRTYLIENPPPADCWNGVDVFTAYHKVENPTAEGTVPGDEDVINPFKAKSSVFFPRLQKFAYLSVFCAPAVCDVMLLVFLGRGVFQSAFMKGDEVAYSTLGLLTALLICSGTIAWTGSSGGYYLYNAAFDSLNHLMVQKLSGAFCLTLAVGILGGLGIGGQRGWYPGLIFFIYLMGLSTYLNILGILATMHRDGSPLPSGRSVLWKSLPILVISPIVTTFVHGYDIVIYILVIYTFLTVLYFNYRALCAEWSQFYTKIKCIDDKQVIAWYRTKHPDDKEEVEYEVARSALEEAVHKERSPRPWSRQIKPKQIPLEKDMAPGLEYSRWLLAKDAGPGASVPAPYSSAWNNQLKVSLNTYQNFVRGLKEHSAFLQYRYAKNDIGYNVVMFIAVLLDRWVAITMSAAGDGPLNLYKTPRNRFGIAFALSYFLTSAVALDYQLQFCWIAVVATSTRSIDTPDRLTSEEQRERGRKTRLYWKSLVDLVTIMLLLFGFWTLLLVFWVDDVVQLETYFAYAGAYTFVLWFQFNRVFIKDATKAFLLVAGSIALGYTTGVVLHVIPATYNFHFIDIIAMAVCNVTAGILSFCATDFGSDRDDVEDDFYTPQDLMHKTGWKLHSQKFVGLDWNASNRLKSTLDLVSILPDPKKLLEITDQRTPEVVKSIKEIFELAKPTRRMQKAYPKWRDICETALDRFKSGRTRIYLLSHQDLVDRSLGQVSALGRLTDEDILEICLPVLVVSEAWTLLHHERLAQLISEALIHETCELVLRMSHSDSVCAERIVAQQSLPLRITTQIQSIASAPDVEYMTQATASEILNHCCLGIPVNVQWTLLPEDLRRLIAARVQGHAYIPGSLCTDYIENTLTNGTTWQEAIARSDARISLALSIDSLCQNTLDSGNLCKDRPILPPPNLGISTKEELVTTNDLRRRIFYALYTFIQYIAVISNGDPDVPRELVYLTRGSAFRLPIRWFVLFFWRLCAAFRRFSVELTLLHSRPELKSILEFCRYGVERRLFADRIVVKDPLTSVTGFKQIEADGTIVLSIYNGILEEEPSVATKLNARATFDNQERLSSLESIVKGEVSESSTYSYDNPRDRIPICRVNKQGTSFYDVYGRVSHGSILTADEEWKFEHTFSKDTGRADILHANFTSIDLSIQVYWCTPRSNTVAMSISEMLPTRKASRIVYTKNLKRWDIQYTYHHKRDPTTVCAVTEVTGETHYINSIPEWISKDPNKFAVKPKSVHFETENLLFRHPPIKTLSLWQQLLHKCSIRASRVSYSSVGSDVLRTMLWEKWHKSKSLDGVTACYVDTQIVRHEGYLKEYWSLRESGYLYEASHYLDEHVDSIIARIDIEDSVSQNTFLPYKMSDLYTMGVGGSANVKTRKFEENYADTDDRLSVMFLDTGCFPDQPGGVSNCRRDLVNGHTTIRNHVFTESANDFGVPRFQVDRNVQSVKVLPMWGLDYLSPYHGLFENLLDSQVTYREHHTTDRDIEVLFLPILRRLVKGARSLSYTQQDLVELTQAFVDINIYFEEKDYLKTWSSDLVKSTWRESWLADTSNSISTSTYFKLELPSMAQLDEALELWRRYFFVFSVRIPEVVPTVFQCTHHGVGSIFGMLLKLRRGTTYMIWDHAIYWRESCLNVSSSQCILSLSVQNMLLSAIKMASHLCYTHADVILPCTNLFNPGWEADIGSDQGRRLHKTGFARKIDPVVNGISEMERFEPVDKIGSEFPTVMMLSNVQFIKDVKNAVFSADIIVNRFKFTKYRLVIYGAMDRTPQYTAETEAIIKTRNLGENVKLAGFGNPKEILKNAWAFMNSSLSEGLPLAIGEAALSGCPIIATDVGATALVISDPKNPKIRYGEIVPPNDSVALARAQIQILAMLGPWAKYCGDEPPPMPEHFTTEDVDRITQRMYDQTEARRALGRKGRETVLHSFNGNRYLREHEQMYWLGSYRAKQRADPALKVISEAYVKFDETKAIDPVIPTRRSKLWDENPWRYFENRDGMIERFQRRAQAFFKSMTTKNEGQDARTIDTELVHLRQPSELDESALSSNSVSIYEGDSKFSSVVSLTMAPSSRKVSRISTARSVSTTTIKEI